MKNGLPGLIFLSVLSFSLNQEVRGQKSSSDTAPRKMQVISGGADQPPPVTATPKPAEKSKTSGKKNSGTPTTGKASGATNSGKSTNTQSKTTTKSSKSKNAKDKKPKSVSLFPGQYPEGSERLLKEEDMEHLTPWGMKVMLNEIYARQGFIFKDEELKKHFAQESWYKGKQTSMSKIKLTTIERQNISFIKAHQGKAKF